MKLYRTSVKEDLNVAVVFQHLAENYVNKVKWNMVNVCFCISNVTLFQWTIKNLLALFKEVKPTPKFLCFLVGSDECLH